MEARDYDPFRTIVDLPRWRKLWVLWRAARRGGF
jgi:phytoene synthase